MLFPLSYSLTKTKREISEPAHKTELRKIINQPTFCGDQYPQSFLACTLVRVKFVAHGDWHFDNKPPMLWLDKCSLKERFDLTWECPFALWGLEVSVATKYD